MQGPRALIAELVAGELGRILGLPIPEIVFADLDPVLGKTEPDYEIRQLVMRSGGLNLALDFLPGSFAYHATLSPPPAPDLASAVVWFDAYVTNVDRTPRNTNILLWHKRPWLIWLVSPSNTIIQTSPTHAGICRDPQAELDHLFEMMVRG